MKKIRWAKNSMPKTADKQLAVMSLENVGKARKFHESFPQYSVTPLAQLKGMAEYLGLGSLFVKDESYRFGLNAFKVLGGSFAMARYIAGQLGKDVSEVDYNYLTGDKLKEEFGQATFFTATDGNHGRGVAWAANRLGQKAVVLMPKGSVQSRFNNIAKEGAQVSIEEVNYDECVRRANAMAEKTEHGVMVQDTAWEGYEDIPSWIMQGYTTMALEAVQQLEQIRAQRPTHIFLQAGVGALSGGLTGFFADLYGDEERPIITIVEPNKADCIYRTAQANDGKLHFVTGRMDTIMAGLACGEPCTIGWEVLRDHADNFVSCPDYVAAKGMRVLGNPMPGDQRVISGESGAATLGFVAEVMQNESLDWLREALQLNENSRVLCFSTEGDTDRANYRRIVWDGLHPSF